VVGTGFSSWTMASRTRSASPGRVPGPLRQRCPQPRPLHIHRVQDAYLEASCSASGGFHPGHNPASSASRRPSNPSRRSPCIISANPARLTSRERPPQNRERQLAGGLVLPDDLGADPAAAGDRQTCLPGPCPNGSAIDPARSRTARAPPPTTAADPPAAVIYGATASANRVLFGSARSIS
jgi:hypothetical protein